MKEQLADPPQENLACVAGLTIWVSPFHPDQDGSTRNLHPSLLCVFVAVCAVKLDRYCCFAVAVVCGVNIVLLCASDLVSFDLLLLIGVSSDLRVGWLGGWARAVTLGVGCFCGFVFCLLSVFWEGLYRRIWTETKRFSKRLVSCESQYVVGVKL